MTDQSLWLNRPAQLLIQKKESGAKARTLSADGRRRCVGGWGHDGILLNHHGLLSFFLLFSPTFFSKASFQDYETGRRLGYDGLPLQASHV